jgi:hypothetical protein
VIARGSSGALAAFVATMTIVAGCVGGSGSASSDRSRAAVTAASTSSPSVVLTPPTQPASPSPTRSPTPSSSAEAGRPTAGAGLPHADVDLERYVPPQIGGVGLDQFSLAGPNVPPAGGDMCLFLCGNEPREFADALGIPLARITVALAMSEHGAIGGIAFRAKGVATDRLAAAGAAISGGVVGGGPSFPMKVAGRDVTYVARLGRGQYLIPIDDVLVFLYGEPPVTAPGHISPTGTVPPDVVSLIEALPR